MSDPVLLTVDIGNTNVSLGIFNYEGEEGTLSEHWRLSTHRDQTSDELSITLRARRVIESSSDVWSRCVLSRQCSDSVPSSPS